MNGEIIGAGGAREPIPDCNMLMPLYDQHTARPRITADTILSDDARLFVGKYESDLVVRIEIDCDLAAVGQTTE